MVLLGRQAPGFKLDSSCEFYPLDLDVINEDDLIKSLQDCDVLIHLAARVHEMTGTQNMNQYSRTNEAGSRSLFLAAIKAKLKQVIFISTVKVHGEKTLLNEIISEESAQIPLEPYAVSKKASEDALKEELKDSGLSYTILRPPLMYGPGVGANFLKLIKLVHSRFPLPFNAVENTRSILYVTNFCDVIKTCILNPLAYNKTYLVRDQDLSTPELCRQIAKASDLHIRLFPMPVGLLQFLAKLAGKQAAINRLTESLLIDDGKIRRELKWQPPNEPARAMQATIDWYRQHD